jgi:hypothetical protein
MKFCMSTYAIPYVNVVVGSDQENFGCLTRTTSWGSAVRARIYGEAYFGTGTGAFIPAYRAGCVITLNLNTVSRMSCEYEFKAILLKTRALIALISKG